MPLLKLDDEARHVPSVWLGDPSLIRWPFDASFSQWILGFSLLLPTFTTLGLFVPVIVWAGIASWFFGKFVAQRFSQRFEGDGSVVSRVLLSAWSWRTVAFLLFAAILPNPFAWVLPVNIVAAFLLTPVAVFLLVRKFSHYITPMTPLLYWFAVLGSILRRPRTPRVAAQEFSVFDPALATDGELDFDLDDLPDFKDK